MSLKTCLGFFGLSLKLMTGDNLVPLELGYSQTILCQFLEALNTDTGEGMFINLVVNYVQKPCVVVFL